VHPRIPFQDQLAPHLARALLHKPGQIVRSSLDGGLQRFALDTLQRHLAELKERQVEDGAVVVLDNQTGEVLAHVGSSQFTSDAAEVDAARAPRLAGSTLKPFLYALAIEKRLLTAASLLDDSPLAVQTPGGQYLPQNYDRDFKGWVSVRTALASSLNVPAVRTLALLEPEPFFDQLRQLGFSTLTRDAEHYGYALALGGAEVTLLELANAYRTLANGGLASAPTFLPTDRALPRKRTRVIEPATAWIVSDILADRDARALTFGLDNALGTNGWSAVKTGTSKDMRDNWCVGYSNRFTVGVWIGNASGEPMHEVSGVTGAAPVWQAIMNRLHARQPDRAPKSPRDIEFRQVRFEPAIEPPRREAFIKGTGMALASLPEGSIARPRIIGPGDGAMLALDPDIPGAHQIVHFRARPFQPGLKWKVDGHETHQGDQGLRWSPSAGVHTIQLLDEHDKLLDETRLIVRGKSQIALSNGSPVTP
jgi:penicillin-binding protein 1C